MIVVPAEDGVIKLPQNIQDDAFCSYWGGYGCNYAVKSDDTLQQMFALHAAYSQHHIC